MILSLAMAMLAQSASATTAMEVKLHPAQPLIEQTRMGQAVNFEFEMINGGKQEVELSAIRAEVRDAGGAIVQRLEVNDNGIAPGIETIPDRKWKPGETGTIFNPFHTLAPDVPIGRIDFEFVLRAGDKEIAPARISVSPSAWRQKTALILPMRGRLLVWDGHDHLSHHRRWDVSHPIVRKLGLVNNASRYSFDLVVADADGRFFKEKGQRREDHLSWGAKIVAPGAGRIVAAVGTARDDPKSPSDEDFKKDGMSALFGNYIVIDHGNGEYSQLGHLRQGSLLVKVGDRVTAGQQIAEAGESGTSLFPHLHYQLTDKPGIDAEGLPARFANVTRLLGSGRKQEDDAWIDTGDIVEAP